MWRKTNCFWSVLVPGIGWDLAEKAMELAIAIGKKYQRNEDHLPYMIGKLKNSLLSAQTQWKAMYALTNNYDFAPIAAITTNILSFKTNVAETTMQIVADAMDAIGGQSFYRANGLEDYLGMYRQLRFIPYQNGSNMLLPESGYFSSA